MSIQQSPIFTHTGVGGSLGVEGGCMHRRIMARVLPGLVVDEPATFDALPLTNLKGQPGFKIGHLNI